MTEDDKVTDPFLHEDDELEKVKAWWKENGKSIIFGVALGLAIIIGTNAWKSWKIRQAEQASTLYEQMLAEQGGNKDVFIQAGERLIGQYAGTGYAGLAGLMLAKRAYDDGDVAGAVEKLEWVMANANMPSGRTIARIRLAALYIDSGDNDKAAALLAVSNDEKSGFESYFAELEGDIKRASGDEQGARERYTVALKELAQGSPYEKMLQMKRDDVGGSGDE